MSNASHASRFLSLHVPGHPLLMPNAWDAGSARMLASLGFLAIATTSSGYAATLGRLDGAVTGEEALTHAAELVAAVEIPVSADLENGFADDPEGVAETARRAVDAGLAGFSIEDYTGDDAAPIYEVEQAAERVQAAAEVAHAGEHAVVVTARAENLLRGRDDLDDTIARLQAYEQAGADVLFAPGLREIGQVKAVIDAVGVPVSVLVLPGSPPVSELAAAGVSRVSVGGAFAFAALAAAADAARELLDRGTYDYWSAARAGREVAGRAFPR
jgi:2-methylisocitrate lyase-like PEP mutase family enzyme